jgi:hypothetical protein
MYVGGLEERGFDLGTLLEEQPEMKVFVPMEKNEFVW